MAYTKTAWVNDSAPYIDSTNLNHIETGIENAHADIVIINAAAFNPWVTMTPADNTSVLSTNDRVFADTTSGAFSLLMPAEPAFSDRVVLVDVAGTFGVNNLTLIGNGKIIMGDTSLIINIASTSAEFTYSGSIYGWVISS